MFYLWKNKKNCAKNAYRPVFFITLHVTLIWAICRQGCRAPLAFNRPGHPREVGKVEIRQVEKGKNQMSKKARPPWKHCFLFRVSSFGCRLSSLEFRVSSFEFRVSSFEFRISSFEFRIFSVKFRVLSFRVSSFEAGGVQGSKV